MSDLVLFGTVAVTSNSSKNLEQNISHWIWGVQWWYTSKISTVPTKICIWKTVIPWVVPLPRMPVTTRIITFLGSGSQPKPSFATGILGGGTTQVIPVIITLSTWTQQIPKPSPRKNYTDTPTAKYLNPQMLIVSLPTKDDLPIKWEMNINNACELYVKCSQISLISNFF